MIHIKVKLTFQEIILDKIEIKNQLQDKLSNNYKIKNFIQIKNIKKE
jgi:hypothetical protein